MNTQRAPAIENSSGNFHLIDTLSKWGIRMFAGINGGGLVHVAKHLQPFSDLSHADDGIPRLFTLSEYAAGFVPLGYYLASGRIAGCMTTTGAATKLGSSGLTDAKLHNIPAVYVIALNSTLSIGLGPLQDVSEYGMNIVPQLQAELGDGCIVLDDIDRMEEQLGRAQEVLNKSRPVAIAFHPDILSQSVEIDVPKVEKTRDFNRNDVEAFLAEFPQQANGRRVIMYVGSEASFCEGIEDLSTQLSELLEAPTVWSVNGANSISRENRYGYGYISFGGNEKAMEVWQSVNEDDVVIALGFDAGEYSLNLREIPAGTVWHFTDMPEAYGQKNGDFRHRVTGEYVRVRGDIGRILEEIIPRLRANGPDPRPKVETHENLNTRTISREVREGAVDFVAFYEALDRLWRPNSMGIDDVCVAYKDRQYVTQRPNPNIKFYTTHDGSAMGAGYGLGVGAKLGNPDLHTFVFSGDGCWRLFGGALAESAKLDLRLFIINNGTYGIVDKGLEVIIPEIEKPRYHSVLPSIDFVAAAKAHGWGGYYLKPDLSNLEEIMDACYETRGQSILVDVPMDTDQEIGLNPRLLNLTTGTYL